MGRFDELQLMYNAALDDHARGNGKMMAGYVMCKKVGDNNDEVRKHAIDAGKGEN